MSKKILLVDDDIDDQMIISSAIKLIDPNHEFIFASNGIEAIEYIEKLPPFDIVLIDLNMPLMNGFDTLKNIKMINRETPVVMISTSGFKYHIERCKYLGAASYIVKPNSFDELVKELKQVL